mmetsp:Transcript_50734/g.84797  ORF Transcript_50734/g.84797 Transcript_50734/m.84797 type:complete len:238 (+) Transcript_50734:306-1019(+)
MTRSAYGGHCINRVQIIDLHGSAAVCHLPCRLCGQRRGLWKLIPSFRAPLCPLRFAHTSVDIFHLLVHIWVRSFDPVHMHPNLMYPLSCCIVCLLCLFLRFHCTSEFRIRRPSEVFIIALAVSQKTTQSLLHGGNEIPDPHHRNISDVANSSLHCFVRDSGHCLCAIFRSQIMIQHLINVHLSNFGCHELHDLLSHPLQCSQEKTPWLAIALRGQRHGLRCCPHGGVCRSPQLDFPR